MLKYCENLAAMSEAMVQERNKGTPLSVIYGRLPPNSQFYPREKMLGLAKWIYSDRTLTPEAVKQSMLDECYKQVA